MHSGKPLDLWKMNLGFSARPFWHARILWLEDSNDRAAWNGRTVDRSLIRSRDEVSPLLISVNAAGN
jgi:hypothetical protein